MPLFWRVFATNATVIVAAGAVVVATGEVALGLVGVFLALAVNLALLRPAFRPFRRLTAVMQEIDFLRPGQRVDVEGRGDIATLAAAFNDMLTRLESQRQESMALAFTAQEEERRRIARNLHDEIGQSLTAVLLQLDRLTSRVRPSLRDEFREATESVRASLDQVRTIARDLRPGVLEDLGLGSALRELCTTFSQRTGLEIERKIPSRLPALSAEAELAVYRVAQESLTNIVRHSGADRAELRLERVPGGLVLRVSDEGKGLGPAGNTQSLGGMRSMREWALLAGGDLAVSNRRPHGVQVRLRVPSAGLREAAA
jgi:two-component system, NarL family, sensor histidine kinase UhpB